MKNEITIIQPDDFHLHLRDGEMLKFVLPYSAKIFKRAMIMPNLNPPVITLDDAQNYKNRILGYLPKDCDFEPLMTIYLTENHSPADIEKFAESGLITAVKLYPSNATTNSHFGVGNFDKIIPVLEKMAEVNLPLSIHGEIAEAGVDAFDKEKIFVDKILDKKLRKIKNLRIVLEHITTKESVDFVFENENTVATITPQHLVMNRNAIFDGGINPHNYCLPILKHERHRQALLEAIKRPSNKLFLGTDSAPHPKHAKENSCGCAGIFSAFAALPLYAEAFEEAGASDNFENFCSKNGAEFYGLPQNTGKITLVRENWTAPNEFLVNETTSIVPIRAGKNIAWSVKL